MQVFKNKISSSLPPALAISLLLALISLKVCTLDDPVVIDIKVRSGYAEGLVEALARL